VIDLNSQKEVVMPGNIWLPIAEYAGKYGVSISTLRRRIKAGQIQYNFKDGRYLLQDSPASTKGAQGFQSKQASAAGNSAPPTMSAGQSADAKAVNRLVEKAREEDASPVLATANRLLNEIKKAYALILQEKESQILHLREELADLKTLVRVLETENERLNRQKKDLSWLE